MQDHRVKDLARPRWIRDDVSGTGRQDVRPCRRQRIDAKNSLGSRLNIAGHEALGPIAFDLVDQMASGSARLPEASTPLAIRLL